MAKPSQQSIPGTNIPELEEVAEEYYQTVASRVKLQEQEAELKAGLQARVEDCIKARKLKPPVKDGKPHPVYRYTGDKKDGSTCNRVVTYGEKTTCNVAVHNEKSEEKQEQAAA